MSRVSCIEHPARRPFVLLRSEYMEITAGDACAAMLLSVFEHWTNARLNNAEERGGDLWIQRKLDELVDDDLVGAYGRDRVRAGLKVLIDLKLLERRQGTQSWDRTIQYRLAISELQAVVDGLENPLNMQSRISDDAMSEIPIPGLAGDQGKGTANGSGPQGRNSDAALDSNVGDPPMQSRKSDARMSENSTLIGEKDSVIDQPPVGPPEGGNDSAPLGPDSGIRRQRDRDRLAAEQRAWAAECLPDEDPAHVVSVIGWAQRRHGVANAETIGIELRRAGLDAASLGEAAAA